MSQMTAGARLAPRPQRSPNGQGRALRVIRGTVDRPRDGAFAAICLALLVGGFLLVLLLNTSMAKGSFVLDDLQARSGTLADEQGNLRAAIDAQSAPAGLAQRALKLGMVPSTTAAFLDLSDGKVLGVATAAPKSSGFTVITSPTVVAPKRTTVKTSVTRKGTVTTTTVVTSKASGVVETVATSVDSRNRSTRVTTKVVTPQPKDMVRTVVTTVDSETLQKVVTTTITPKPSPTAPRSGTAGASPATAGASPTPSR